MRLYLASGNPHKAEEFRALLSASDPFGIEIFSARDLGGMPPVVEDSGTFLGNARKKASALLPRLPVGTWALSDDSGLCVDALNGAPGVESAYYAGPAGDSGANLRKLVSVMKDVPEGKRGAHFICVLVLLGPGAEERVAQGRCDGRLLFEPRGGSGFGYDPLFVPDGFDKSFAELGEAAKNGLSHRSRAWSALRRILAGT